MKTCAFNEFETLVDRWIQLPPGCEQGIDVKMSLLERRIEQWRIERHHMENTVSFPDAMNYQWLVDGATFHAAPGHNRSMVDSKGTPALRLQCPLLVYLLLHPLRERSSDPSILHVIKGFTKELHKKEVLSAYDFLKTKTGVVRCYTNTRFAANKLRDYGLLKFTKKEAFKVWTLSLPGILVAAEHLTDGKVFVNSDKPFAGLDPRILRVSNEVRNFESLVSCLQRLCKPNAEIFDQFESVLKAAQKLLWEYWEVLHHKKMSAKERSESSLAYTRRLEEISDYPTFIQQLSDSIQIDLLLEQADQMAPDFSDGTNGGLSL